MSNIEDQFKELIKKTDKDKKEKRVNLLSLTIELALGLTGFIMLYKALGGYVTLAVFLILTGNNLQILRNIKKDLDN